MRFRLRTLEDDDKDQQSWITVLFTAGTMLSPLAYILSVGPFVWLFEHGYMDKATYVNLSLIYKPLALLRDNFVPFRWLIEWYISWFQ